MDDRTQFKKVVCKKPWWWWLPLLLLPLLLMFLGNSRIQSDLSRKTRHRLTAASIAGVAVKASGQDITLRGPASARDGAIAAANALKGVRNVKYVVDAGDVVPDTSAAPDTVAATEAVETAAAPEAAVETTVAATTEAPTTAGPTTTAPAAATLNAVATFDGTKVVLTGSVATEAQHAAIVAEAKRVFGDANVVDQMTVNGSGESADLDAAVKNFTSVFEPMKTNLTTGTATLANTVLTVDGSAPSDDAKAAIEGAVTGVTGTSTITANAPTTGAALEADLNKLNSLKGITFETGSDVIRESSKPTLDEAAATITEFFKASSAETIEIGGHTDNVGGDATNLALSQRRANAVLAYLKDKGVDTTRVTAVGYGKTKPIADNTTAAGRAANRRIEFTVSGS